MKKRRGWGVACIVVGILAIFFSMYIKGETEEGQRKIDRAQRQVDTGNKLFSISPVTEPVGKTLTGSAQRRIDEGKQEVAGYEDMAYWLQIGGAILIVVGIGALLAKKKR